MTHPIIECDKVIKEWPLGKGRTFAALRGIDLDVRAGELVILFGPSGSGKSTLLNLIAGLEKVSGGKIKIRGHDLAKFSAKDIANHHRTKIGMVFQQFNLIPTLSVVENIALPQIFASRDLRKRLTRAHHLLELFGLDKYASNSPTELSGGEQQRVAIARALANNPWILLVDEPTGNLDTKSGQEVIDLIHDLNRHSKRTVLLVTHNDAYLNIAHRVIYLLDGQVVKEERRHHLVHRRKTPVHPRIHELAAHHLEKVGQ